MVNTSNGSGRELRTPTRSPDMPRRSPRGSPGEDTSAIQTPSSSNSGSFRRSIEAAPIAIQNGISPEIDLTGYPQGPYIDALLSDFLASQPHSYSATSSPNAHPVPIGCFYRTIGPSFVVEEPAMPPTTLTQLPSPLPRAHLIDNWDDFAPLEAFMSPVHEPGSSSQDNPSPSGPSSVRCPGCDKEFRGEYAKGNMRRHQIYSCTDPSKTRCGDCNKEYARPDGLRAHRKKHHPELLATH